MYGFQGINKQADLHSHFLESCETDYSHNTSYSETSWKIKQESVCVNAFRLPFLSPDLCYVPCKTSSKFSGISPEAALWSLQFAFRVNMNKRTTIRERQRHTQREIIRF